MLAAMTEEQRVGELFMAGTAAAGPVGPAISADITDDHLGSVLLTGRSHLGVTATRRVTSQLQSLAASPIAGNAPLLVSTDQEGGDVQVLSGPGFSDMPSALAQAALGTAQLKADARVWGSQLAAAGVNLDLAPVLDTVPASRAATNKPIGVYQREYGQTPAAVTAAGLAFISGLHAAGVGVTIKHFPGLGRASGNTDTTYGVTDNLTTSGGVYLDPYKAAVSTGQVQVVMVSLAIYTKIDPTRQAAFSPAVLGGMIRRGLGFRGPIISDSLDATAVDHMTRAQRALDFISAGGDIALVTNPADIPVMYNAVLARAKASPVFARLVSQAALTVLTAKASLGVLSPGGAAGAQ